MLDVRSAPIATGEARIAVSGEIDLGTAPQLESALADALSATPAQITIDLSAVDFIDSTGVSVLVRSAHQGEQNGVNVRVHGAHGIVARVLAVTGVAGYLQVPVEDEV
jgi:anti-sigma B factor antagonist